MTIEQINDIEIERVYNKAFGHIGKTDFNGLRAFAEAIRAQMIADGWRNCAQGQSSTQFCRLLHQAVEAERDQLLPLLEMAAPFVFAVAEESHRLHGGVRLPIDELVERMRAVLPESKHD